MDRTKFFAELDEKLKALPGPVIHDREGVIGVVRYRLLGPDGAVKAQGEHRNLVNSIGDMYLAQLMANSIVGNPASMWAELGVNTTAPAKGDTGLGTLVNASSVVPSAGYPVRVTSHSGAGEWTLYRFSWGAGVATNGSLGEVGMRTQAGSFIAHALLSPNVNKGANDTLQADWGIKFQGA